MISGSKRGLFYTEFSLFDLPCHWLVATFDRRGKKNEYSCGVDVMGSCTWFGAVSRDLGYRESLLCTDWRTTGRRKESYNVGVRTLPSPAVKWTYVMNRAGKRTVCPERVVCGG